MSCRTLFYSFLLLLLGSSEAAQCQVFTATDSASIWPHRVYVVLEETPFPVHHVQSQSTGNKTAQFGIVSVEIYNLLIPVSSIHKFIPAEKNIYSNSFIAGDTLLITLSALPDNKGNVLWQPVDLDTISSRHRLSVMDVARDGAQRLLAYHQTGTPPNHALVTRTNLFPVVQRQGHYWTPSSFVLTQYFLVRSRATSSLIQTDYVTINVKSPVLSSDAPWRTMLALLPATSKHNYTRTMPIGIVREGTYRGMSEFWSRPSIMVSHPGLRDFGIGVFEYKPGFGVVSGQYAHYFQEFTPFFSRMFFSHVMLDGKRVLR